MRVRFGFLRPSRPAAEFRSSFWSRSTPSFCTPLLRRSSDGARTLYVVEGQRAAVRRNRGGRRFLLGALDRLGSRFRVWLPSRTLPAGRWWATSTRSRGSPASTWRLVIVEPESTVPIDTLSTLWPTIVVLTIGGLIALVMAWVMARRVVAPLRTLEVAALRAASGAYVRPIEARREDELGQVAKAFNAVALRLNALHDLSQLLASSSQLDQVLDGILSAMGHIVGPGVAAIYLLDETGRWLMPVRARGADISLAPAIDSTSDMWLARAMDDIEPSAFVESRPLAGRGAPGSGARREGGVGRAAGGRARNSRRRRGTQRVLIPR